MVIAIIGLLIALLLPAVQQSRERARVVQCQSQLRQLGLAVQSYESTHQVFPSSLIRQEDGNPPPPSVSFGPLRYRSHWTGFHLLLPYFDQGNLAAKYDFRDTWLSPLSNANDHYTWPLNQTTLLILLCPSASHSEMKIGGDAAGTGVHWMAGSPTDYSFCHGADMVRALPGDEVGCQGGLLHYWSQIPSGARGAFGYNSTCKPGDVTDGLSNTIFLGEKVGGRLTYAGWNSSFPNLPVEYPWAMAAVEYFAPTGNAGVPGSAWVVGPFAVTQDFRLPQCPESTPGSGTPFPMNPTPVQVSASSDERPFYSFQTRHMGGPQFLFGDGSVRNLSPNLHQPVFQALSTIGGGETTSSGSY